MTNEKLTWLREAGTILGHLLEDCGSIHTASGRRLVRAFMDLELGDAAELIELESRVREIHNHFSGAREPQDRQRVAAQAKIILQKMEW